MVITNHLYHKSLVPVDTPILVITLYELCRMSKS